MTDEGMPEWAKTVLKLLAVPGEIVVSAHGFPGFVTAGGTLLESLARERRRDADEFAGVVIAFVGRDRLFDIVQGDDERGEMIFSGAQAAMSTGHDGKRILMARVVANAMTSDEPIDEAQLILWALIELEAPHFRALKQVQVTQDVNHGKKDLDDILEKLLKSMPYPVLATLTRTGVVRQGSENRGDQMYSVMHADTLGIGGISDFGRTLLADLESVEAQLWTR